ncbi:MAG: hypothetical protein LBC83_06680 [Oscillospiraceae bacterium]|nr:hypothetical protein [Oscillospiraceae bacterium]
MTLRSRANFLFAVLSLILTAIAMTYIETGLRRDKAVIITSADKMQQIQAAIINSIQTRTTVLQAADGITGTQSPSLLVVLDDSDYPKLLRLLDIYDKNAAVAAFNIAARGKGEAFRMKSKTITKGGV